MNWPRLIYNMLIELWDKSKDRDEDALRHDIIRLAKMYGRYDPQLARRLWLMLLL